MPQLSASDAQQHTLSSSGRIRPTVHPRNRYADQQPDFQALGKSYPDLQRHIRVHQGKATIDFRKPPACKALTKALLKHDFEITWDIPDGQLVPPITTRANYIHWLEDLLQLSPPQKSDCITGLDIGCGANCIYPLLGATLNNWHFVGTDITDVAVQWANKNVNHNPHLAQLIEIRCTGQSKSPLDVANVDQVGNLTAVIMYAQTTLHPPTMTTYHPCNVILACLCFQISGIMEPVCTAHKCACIMKGIYWVI